MITWRGRLSFLACFSATTEDTNIIISSLVEVWAVLRSSSCGIQWLVPINWYQSRSTSQVPNPRKGDPSEVSNTNSQRTADMNVGFGTVGYC